MNLSLENALTISVLLALADRGHDWALAALAVWCFVVVVFNVKINQTERTR